MDSSDASTAALCLAASLLLVYNVSAYALQQTGLRLALRANPAWAQRHLDEAGAPETTLAIKTLRNTVLVATFVGTLVFGQTTRTSPAACGAAAAAPREAAAAAAARCSAEPARPRPARARLNNRFKMYCSGHTHTHTHARTLSHT